MAGAAGAALLEARSTRDVYATTTDTNFVATGNVGGGGTGFLTTAPSTASFAVGADVTGNQYGVSATGLGNVGVAVFAQASGSIGVGVKANGGGTGIQATGTSFFGVNATGPTAVLAQGTGVGVQASASGTNGVGVAGSATDLLGGVGVHGSGGALGGSFSGSRSPINLAPGHYRRTTREWIPLPG